MLSGRAPLCNVRTTRQFRSNAVWQFQRRTPQQTGSHIEGLGQPLEVWPPDQRRARKFTVPSKPAAADWETQTKHLQNVLADCGWEGAADVRQQDASEAFTFITGALELPLLTLKMDIYHTGREDQEDDHKFVNERQIGRASCRERVF